jgi:uncharacterized protein
VFDKQPNPSSPETSRSDEPRAPYAWMSGQTPATGATQRPGALPGAVNHAEAAVVAREGFLTESFVWMFLALLVSAATAAFTYMNPTLFEFVIDNYFVMFLVLIGMSIGISAGINRIGALPGLALLFAFAVVNGMTLSIVAYVYTSESILTAFLGASSIFGAAALYGVVTKRDLTGLGPILFMGVIGIVVVSVVNFFFYSSVVSFALGIVGVVVFTALTAYDVQRINNGDLRWIKTREAASVVGALFLYIDFINLFISLLRIFGSRR